MTRRADGGNLQSALAEHDNQTGTEPGLHGSKRARRFDMKRLITLAVMVAVLGIGVGPALAAMDSPRIPPKGTEGPDIKARVEPRGVEGPDVRARVEPKGVEGPDVRLR